MSHWTAAAPHLIFAAMAEDGMRAWQRTQCAAYALAPAGSTADPTAGCPGRLDSASRSPVIKEYTFGPCSRDGHRRRTCKNVPWRIDMYTSLISIRESPGPAPPVP
eukprot:1159778-Pelagomonas_calceolata.AAC.4